MKMNENLKKEFSEFEKKLGLNFKNKDLFIQAFCHRSYLNENPGFNLGQNERLEFLGDAVLELVVTEHLYLSYPQKSEGELTTWRASLVNTKVIGSVAEKAGFYDNILLSKGEKKEEGKSRMCILANTFEAVIGAIYLDMGYSDAKKFIKERLIIELPRIIELELYKDPKSLLQEKIQEEGKATPIYETIKEGGPDHKKHFTVGVLIEGEINGKGRGYSKKEAEEEAAKDALQQKGWLKSKN